MIAITMHCFVQLQPGSKHVANTAEQCWRLSHLSPLACVVGVNPQVKVQKVVPLFYPEHLDILKNSEKS